MGQFNQSSTLSNGFNSASTLFMIFNDEVGPYNMNRFNKSEAAFFLVRAMLPEDFPFYQFVRTTKCQVFIVYFTFLNCIHILSHQGK